MFRSKIVALAALTGALLLVGSSSAQAAPTPQSICGSGYSVQTSHALTGARVYLLYNGSSNCVVTIKTSSVGTPTRTTAGLQVAGGQWAYDTGMYTQYAGPVKQAAAGKCVRYFGFHAGSEFTSPFGHCG